MKTMRFCYALTLLFCFFVQIGMAQNNINIQEEFEFILNELKEEEILPFETSLVDIEKGKESLNVLLEIPMSFLQTEITEDAHEEIIEHFSRPIHKYNYNVIVVKTKDPVGKFVELSRFLDPIYLAAIELPFNDDPFDPISGSRNLKSIDLNNLAQAKGQLNDCTVWLSAGHGWKYDKKRKTYRTQRHNTFGIVEDFATIEMVNYHLLKYLNNAGANVWTVRERDMNTNEVIVDNDMGRPYYKENGKWYTSSISGYKDKTYRYSFSNSRETSSACFQPDIPEAGMYWVSAHYKASVNRSVDVRYKIIHAGGESMVSINQEIHGDTWVYLGQFYFEKGSEGRVALLNESSDVGQAIIADAIRFGGGMGSVKDCAATTLSGEPRFEEAAKQYAKFQGYPECVNDVIIRPHYAEWELSKGSAKEKKNAVYVSIHTNGSGAKGTETYLHRYKPVDGSWSLRQFVHKELIKDIQKAWNPNWVDRGMKAADFGELRGLKTMPGIILELGFHDNEQEAKILTDPKFRQLAARSIYKGIVRFFAKQHGKTPLFLPEPPTHLHAYNNGNGKITIKWKAPKFGGAYGDKAEKYKVYISRHGKAFASYENSSIDQFSFSNLIPGATYYFRIVAINKGGESLPSAVVAVRTPLENQQQAHFLIVDGFDRMDRGLAPIVHEQKPFYFPLGATRRLFIDRMNNYDYAMDHAESLENVGLTFDGATNEAVVDRMIKLDDYDGVDWFVGRESVEDETLSLEEQYLIKRYLDAGGNLIISGSELGYDLDYKNNGRTFYNDYLKAEYLGDNAQSGKISNSDFFSQHVNNTNQSDVTFNNAKYGYYAVTSPDFIGPINDSKRALFYPNGKTAALTYKGDFGLVHFAFPLETISDIEKRNHLFNHSVKLLNPSLSNKKNVEIVVPTRFKKKLNIEFSEIKGETNFRLINQEGIEVFSSTWDNDGANKKSFNFSKLASTRYQYEIVHAGKLQRGYVVKE